jgi:hypothetical protein
VQTAHVRADPEHAGAIDSQRANGRILEPVLATPGGDDAVRLFIERIVDADPYASIRLRRQRANVAFAQTWIGVSAKATCLVQQDAHARADP